MNPVELVGNLAELRRPYHRRGLGEPGPQSADGGSLPNPVTPTEQARVRDARRWRASRPVKDGDAKLTVKVPLRR